MPDREAKLLERLRGLSVPTAVVLPGGRRLGDADARLTLTLQGAGPLMNLATGSIGRLAEDYVEGALDVDGAMRDLMAVAGAVVGADPVHDETAAARWWAQMWRGPKSRRRHSRAADARQVQQHYDVSDDFYALWLDERRVYSCAYWAAGAADLSQAQAAKLDHVCRKLMLRPGERLLDIGAGWGALLLWAAERYGVDATGITLSRHQHAHASRLIAQRGLGDRARIHLLDYRDLPETQPFDKIASIGMFEHVGRARLPTYFAKIRRLLRPGGLLLNHGITAGGTRNAQLGAGIGDFIERYIFPGGELLHASHVLKVMADCGLETVDMENLRPHYARTLWAWSDALEARLGQARRLTTERLVRAYRLYLAGSAMAFERGWMSLHQMLATHPSGVIHSGPMRGAQSDYPFQRGYMYAAAQPWRTSP